VWRPTNNAPIVLTETLGPEIVDLHQRYKVAAVYYDPYQMAAIAEICKRAGVPMVEFPQTTRRVQSDTHLYGLIVGRNLRHYGDPTLGLHVTNALSKSGERGLRIVKESSASKVDAAVALSMSALGAVEMLADRSKALELARNPFYEGKS
jgi:phage terminase large subunit-like protein